MVVRGDTGSRKTAGQTGMDLEQVAAVDGGVVRRSAGDEEDYAAIGGDFAQSCALRPERLDGPGQSGRLFGDLPGHRCRGLVHVVPLTRLDGNLKAGSVLQAVVIRCRLSRPEA